MQNQDNMLPFGKVVTVEAIGKLVRAHRKSQAATQTELASLCGVGVRFISDLENGKPTMELGKVLHVLQCLGLEVSIQPRGWRKSLSATLKADHPVTATGSER
ncbi:MAG: helix-turn-helix transcriptional regulator [Pseudomonadota bacterium]